MTASLERDPMRPAECRRALEVSRAQPPSYAPLLTLSDRRLRLLAEWESIEALKMARAAGLETPCR